MIAHLHASVNFFIYGLANKSLRAGYRDFMRRLFSLCRASATVGKATYSPAKDDVFTDPDYGRQEPRRRLSSLPRRLSTQAKQEDDRQELHVNGNERAAE